MSGVFSRVYHRLGKAGGRDVAREVPEIFARVMSGRNESRRQRTSVRTVFGSNSLSADRRKEEVIQTFFAASRNKQDTDFQFILTRRLPRQKNIVFLGVNTWESYYDRPRGPMDTALDFGSKD